MNLKPKRLHVLSVKVKELLLIYVFSDFMHTPANIKEGAISNLSKEKMAHHLKILN